ncbi:MAG: ABC transporter permease [Acidimicrobiales bacterium]
MDTWRTIRWLTRRWLRRRVIAALPVALVTAAGVTGAVVALAAADRTANAYPDYLERSNAGDVVLNPSLATAQIDEVIRSLPDVEQVTTEAMLSATLDDGAPRPRRELEIGASVIVFGSADGRYIETDRPIVRAGRLATGPNEAMLTVDAAERTGLGVGDVTPLAFWAIGNTDTLAPDISDDEFAEFMAVVVEPIDVERVEIVGIVTVADEVLPDNLYPRGELIVSPDIAARYDCIPRAPGPGVTPEEFRAAVFPPDCAIAYRYYSLALGGGATAVKPALDSFVGAAVELNEDIRTIGVDAEYFMIPTETSRHADAVERAIRPTVAALVVVGLAAVAITIALVGLLAVRELRRTSSEQRQLLQLGIGTAGRALVSAVPLAAAVTTGVAVGAGAGWLLDTGPVGLVSVLESDAERRIDGTAVLAAGGTGIVALLAVVALALLAARRRPDTPARPQGAGGGIRRFTGTAGPPTVADGVRAAYGQRSAIPVVAICATLVGTFVAAAVFATSFSRLVSTPASYGWPWDVAAITGGGYGELDVATAADTLAIDPDVASWTVLGFVNEVSLDNEPMAALITLDRVSDVTIPVLDGALPVRADEIAIGATTAAERGLDVGDTVTIGGAFAPIRATVSGVAVFPALGPWFADRVGAGTGLLIPQAMLEAVALRFDIGLDDVTSLATFVGADVRDDADSPATRARLIGQMAPLDIEGIPPFIYDGAVEPPEILGARSTLGVPVAVSVVFAVMAGVGLAFASWASVRSRRRQLAVLRSLGFCSRQVRRSVRVQSVATMAAALAVGVPTGVIAGRWLWRSFAGQLGVVPDPASPLAPVLLAVGCGLVLAVFAAQVPAMIAARALPADGLRTE